mgnify:FL=1
MRRLLIMLLAVHIVVLASCSDDNAQTESVAVTGETTCVVESGGTWSGPPLDESGLPGSTQSDYVLSCTGPASDPRAEVSWINTINCDFVFDGEATVGTCQGTSVGTNDAGTWEGTLVGTTTWSKTNPGHMHVADVATVGSDGYVGLTFVYTVEGIDDPWTLTGTIGSAG